MRKQITLVLLATAAAVAGCEQASQPAPSDSATESESSKAQVLMNLPMTTDSEAARDLFLAGVHANDVGRFTEANLLFEQAVEAHKGRVFTLAYYILGKPEDAEEILQEVLLKLWRHRRKVEVATA